MDIKYSEELNFIYLDIEKEFVPIAQKGYKLLQPIIGVVDDLEVELLEILPNPSYKNDNIGQFIKVKINMKQMVADGKFNDEIVEDTILLEFLEKAKIIDEYAEQQDNT